MLKQVIVPRKIDLKYCFCIPLGTNTSNPTTVLKPMNIGSNVINCIAPAITSPFMPNINNDNWLAKSKNGIAKAM